MNDYIRGILDALSKLYLKVPITEFAFIIAEINDIPGLPGYFILNKKTDLIEFKNTKLF